MAQEPPDKGCSLESTVRFLETRYKDLYEAGLATDHDMPKFKPAISDWEDSFFISGLRKGVFSIDPEGYAQSSMLPGPAKGSTTQKMLQLFWNYGEGRRRLFREGVCQLSTAVLLIERYGWPAERIEMEPKISAYGPLAYAIDILVNTKQGTPLICCEVKSSTREHKKLISAFKGCCAKGPHEKSDCPNKSNHPKYAMCEAVKARYFLAVSPKQLDCYSLTHLDDQILLTPLDDVPSFREVDPD